MISGAFPTELPLTHSLFGEEGVDLRQDVGSGVHVPHYGAHIPDAQGLLEPEPEMNIQDNQGDMPASPTLPERIQARLRELNLSARAASLKAGLGETAIKAILGGRSKNPSIETLRKIAQALEMPLDALTGAAPMPRPSRTGDNRGKMTGHIPAPNARLAPDAPMPFGVVPMSVPIYGTAEAGPNGAMEVNVGDVIGHAPRYPSLQTMGREVFALYVQGDSMAPWRQPGELVYVTGDRPASPGCHVVVMLEDGAEMGERAFVKRLVRQTARELVLEQYNPPKEIVIPRTQVRRVYRVIEWQQLLGI